MRMARPQKRLLHCFLQFITSIHLLYMLVLLADRSYILKIGLSVDLRGDLRTVIRFGTRVVYASWHAETVIVWTFCHLTSPIEHLSSHGQKSHGTTKDWTMRRVRRFLVRSMARSIVMSAVLLSVLLIRLLLLLAVWIRDYIASDDITLGVSCTLAWSAHDKSPLSRRAESLRAQLSLQVVWSTQHRFTVSW